MRHDHNGHGLMVIALILLADGSNTDTLIAENPGNLSQYARLIYDR